MPHRSTKHGVTIIELLVALAVLAILLAILIPALASVRASARNAQCLSNLRAIGVAVSLYHHDNDLLPDVGVNPAWDENPSGTVLAHTIASYMDTAPPEAGSDAYPGEPWSVAGPWACPSDTGTPSSTAQLGPAWETYGTS